MGWLSDLFSSEDASKKTQRAPAVRVARVRTLIDPTLNYAQTTGGSRYGGEKFKAPEYDLVEIGQVEDTESMIMQAHMKKSALMFKEGECFYGQNPQSLKYVQKRVRQIARASGKSWYSLLRAAGVDLIRYSNSLWVKVRKDFDAKGRPVSGGMVRKTAEGQKIKPVAAYFHLSPETIEIKRSKSGRITHYRQTMPDGSHKTWRAQDVIHFRFNQKGHFDVGTPILVPVLDDIRALRRIEQNVEMLIYQHLFPLLQYKVGTEDAPAEIYSDNTGEIDLVRMEIEHLPSEGMIVTPDRHEIVSIGAEGQALKIEPYLDHFRKRIISGVGMSEVDFGYGDTANRSTADSMSRNLVDSVQDYQQVLSDQIQTEIIDELLLESTFSGDVLSDEFFVGHRFKEIDIDRKIKKENHAMLMYQGNALTEDEMRSAFNLNPLSEEERGKLYLSMVETSQEKMKADEQIRITKAVPKPAAATGSSPQGAKKAAANKNRPKNQHGTKSSPEKRKSFITDKAIGTRFDELRDDVLDLYARDKGLVNVDFIRQLVISGATQVKSEYETRVTAAMANGAVAGGLSRAQAVEFASQRVRPMIVRFNSDVDRLYRLVNRRVQSILNSTSKDKEQEIRIAFNSLRYRTKFIEATDLMRAENFGRARAMVALGIDQAKSVQHSNENDICKQRHGEIFDLRATGIDDLPPYHPNCSCSIHPITPGST